ncbi:MAG: hypothetical protein Q8O13_09260 [Candidatus Omnitrophota bacterium]|nr:hypothetical protein [Candidatus Omnitrophota bacterium]
MNKLLKTVSKDELDYALITFSETIKLSFYLIENPYSLKYSLYLMKKTSGFAKLFHWHVDLGVINIFSKNTLKILLILYRHANYRDFIGIYKRSQIASKGKLFPQQVSTSMKQLIFAGVVEKFKKKNTLYYRLKTEPSPKLINYLNFYSHKTIKTNKKGYVHRDPYTGRYKKSKTNNP